MKAGAYLRVSSEEQRERQTIRTQRQYAERWFTQQGIGPVEYYADDGVSGTLPLNERPEGARLLAAARAGLIGSVAVYKVDRLGRDPLVTLQAATDLANAGVELQSMTETIDNQTPHGRFSLVMLCGVAGYERDNLVARSVEGTNRLAREGTWLGGIVPFGYVVVGKDRNARLAIVDDPIPGLDMSEADVVRLIYRLSAEDGWSCQRIADRLNELGVPTVYVRDGRGVERGKRKVRTSGRWMASRVRNITANTTYKGLHVYGKRSRKQRELIERAVPAIVNTEMWDEAQATLRHNQLFSPRNARRRYLLRGLMKCGHCGLTYSGTSWSNAEGVDKSFYTCNGRSQARGLYGTEGKRCPAKAVPGRIEDLVWSDIVGWAHDPGPALSELHAAMRDRGDEGDRLRRETDGIERALRATDGQRDRVLGLYRRAIIDDAAVERQLREIESEERRLRADLDEAREVASRLELAEAQLQTAEDLLRDLRQRVQEPLTWDLKREIVETLVAGIRVDTEEDEGKQVPVVSVRYYFTPVATRTGTGSSPPPG